MGSISSFVAFVIVISSTGQTCLREESRRALKIMAAANLDGRNILRSGRRGIFFDSCITFSDSPSKIPWFSPGSDVKPMP